MPADSVEVICNMALGYAGIRTRINSIEDASASAQACKVYYAQYRDDLLNDYRWPFATHRADLVPYTGVAWTAAQTFNLGDLTLFGVTVYRSLQAANLNNQPNVSPAFWFQVTRDGWAFACPLPPDFLDEQWVYNKPTLTNTAVINSFQPPKFSPIRNPRPEERVPFAIEDANDGSGNQILLTDADKPTLVYTAQITNPRSFSGPFTKALAWRLAKALVPALRADIKAAEWINKAAEMEVRESVATEQRGIREDVEPASEFEAARES